MQAKGGLTLGTNSPSSGTCNFVLAVDGIDIACSYNVAGATAFTMNQGAIGGASTEVCRHPLNGETSFATFEQFDRLTENFYLGDVPAGEGEALDVLEICVPSIERLLGVGFGHTVVFQQRASEEWQVIVPALPEIVTHGRDLEEAREMARDVIRCVLESACEPT